MSSRLPFMKAPGVGERPGSVAITTVTQLVDTAGVPLLRFAYLLTGDRQRAEDLMQDVYLAMYRRFGDELSLAHPVAYARRAVANAAVSWSRLRSSTELVVDEFGDAAVPASDKAAERDQLWQALHRLPVRPRAVLVLRYYEDASDEDIAEVLGCRRGTVRSLASRGLAALRADPSLTLLEGGQS